MINGLKSHLNRLNPWVKPWFGYILISNNPRSGAAARKRRVRRVRGAEVQEGRAPLPVRVPAGAPSLPQVRFAKRVEGLKGIVPICVDDSIYFS